MTAKLPSKRTQAFTPPQMRATGEQQISLTDPDARAMTSESHNAYVVGDRMLVVGAIEFREVAVDGALGGHHPPCEPVVRKVRLAVVHRLELVSVDGDGDGLEKVKVATSSVAG